MEVAGEQSGPVFTGSADLGPGGSQLLPLVAAGEYIEPLLTRHLYLRTVCLVVMPDLVGTLLAAANAPITVSNEVAVTKH